MTSGSLSRPTRLSTSASVNRRSSSRSVSRKTCTPRLCTSPGRGQPTGGRTPRGSRDPDPPAQPARNRKTAAPQNAGRRGRGFRRSCGRGHGGASGAAVVVGFGAGIRPLARQQHTHDATRSSDCWNRTAGYLSGQPARIAISATPAEPGLVTVTGKPQRDIEAQDPMRASCSRQVYPRYSCERLRCLLRRRRHLRLILRPPVPRPPAWSPPATPAPRPSDLMPDTDRWSACTASTACCCGASR